MSTHTTYDTAPATHHGPWCDELEPGGAPCTACAPTTPAELIATLRATFPGARVLAELIAEREHGVSIAVTGEHVDYTLITRDDGPDGGFPDVVSYACTDCDAVLTTNEPARAIRMMHEHHERATRRTPAIVPDTRPAWAPAFACYGCGYRTWSTYTADVVNDQSGVCPACERPAEPAELELIAGELYVAGDGYGAWGREWAETYTDGDDAVDIAVARLRAGHDIADLTAVQLHALAEFVTAEWRRRALPGDRLPDSAGK